MRSRARGSLAAVMSVLAALLVLTGCARLPMSGEVRVGPVIDGGLNNEQLYYSPSAPSAGATQDEIVSGFLNAGTGPQNDYAVARQYLSEGFRTEWKPTEEVLVETGKPVITFDANKRAQVTIRVQSQLDGRGVYSVAKPGTERTLDITFVRERGEWRISSAPNLTVLIRPIFEAIFHSYTLYFFDNQYKYLVPDLRWFPASASTSTRMVTELFLGPSKWLASAASSPIPAGVKLSIGSVSVANGVASVDLNSKFLSLSATQKMQFKSQLNATLRQLSSVNTVQVLVERSPQSIGDLNARVSGSAGQSPVVLTVDAFAHTAGAISPNFGHVNDLAKKYGANDFAVSTDETHAALLGADGVHLVLLSSIGSSPMLVDSRLNTVRPVFDRQGYLWSAGKPAGSQIRVIGMEGTSRVVPAGWLALANREEIAVSPEGSRIAARINTPSGSQVWVSSIIRDKTGRPIGFGSPMQIAASVKTPISISWAGDVEVVVLDLNDGVRTLPYIATIGADAVSTVSIENGTQVLGSTAGDIFVLNQFGDLSRYRSSNWERVISGVISAHFSGH